MKVKAGFSSQRRLNSPDQFRDVLETGERYSSAHFTCVVLKKEGVEKRLGIMVSRRVGTAVARNRIKRWVRETFRLHQHEFVPGFYLVVRVREKQRLKSFAEAQTDLLQLLRKAKFLIK